MRDGHIVIDSDAERTDLTETNRRNIFGANARRLYPALAKVPVPA